MTTDTRKRNTNWRLNVNPDGTVPNLDAHLAVLMDIRDELQVLNRLLGCPRFTGIPHTLDVIKRNTTKRRRKKATASPRPKGGRP